MNDEVLTDVLKRDRAVVAACLAVLVSLSWTYVVWLADDMAMGGMDMTGFRMIPAGRGQMMPAEAPWRAIEFVFVFVMWAVMMVGMMLPSAAPLILIYTRVARQAAAQCRPFAASAFLAVGYLLAWVTFSLLATGAQWAIERQGWLGPSMASSSTLVAGVMMIVAGLYQWTPLKYSCLQQCQFPLQFIQRHGGFSGDALGSLELGARHGGYCLGCCWALMTLLFIVGVMNVFWIAVLAIFVLVEKFLPIRRHISHLSGALLLAGGTWLIGSALT